MAVAAMAERFPMRWRTHHVLLLPLLHAAAVVALYMGTESLWIRMPWDVVATIALTLAIVLAARLIRAHARSLQARSHGASVMATSRSWMLLARHSSQAMDPADALAERHLAWLAALGYQRRQAHAHAGQPSRGLPAARAMLQRERLRLERKLGSYVGPCERERILAAARPSQEILTLQCESLRALLGKDVISPSIFLELHRLLHELQRLEAAEERMQPLAPCVAARAEALLLVVLILLMPFGLIDAMGPLVLFDDHPIRAIACWAIVPLSTVLVWLYLVLANAAKLDRTRMHHADNADPGTSVIALAERELRRAGGHA